MNNDALKKMLIRWGEEVDAAVKGEITDAGQKRLDDFFAKEARAMEAVEKSHWQETVGKNRKGAELV